MTDRRFVKPKPDLTVPREDGRPLPDHGAGVVWSSYWERRLRDDEIVATDEKSVAAAERKAVDAKTFAANKGGDSK